MPSYPLHLRLTMDADERLAAAAGGAARFFADTAGLASEVILGLQASVLSACKHCFDLHSSTAPCEVLFHRLEDRIEVELPLPIEKASTEKSNLSWTGVDEVRCETRPSSAVLRLTKFIGAPPRAG